MLPASARTLAASATVTLPESSIFHYDRERERIPQSARPMTEHEPAKSATSDGLTLSPSLDLVTEAAQVPPHYALIDGRVLFVCALAVVLGIAAAFVAQFLIGLIALITNLAYFGEFSLKKRCQEPFTWRSSCPRRWW
jgi:hypothetical protein